VLKLLAFVLPLDLDSLAVAAAIGARQVTTAGQRLRLSPVLVIFEGRMPLIGLGLGTALARGIGQGRRLPGRRRVIAIGAWTLLAADKDEDEKASRITTSRGLAVMALGISISLDELAGLPFASRAAGQVVAAGGMCWVGGVRGRRPLGIACHGRVAPGQGPSHRTGIFSRQPLKPEMRARKFGEPALAAHQVIGLAEDPQFAFQDPVQVITFTRPAAVTLSLNAVPAISAPAFPAAGPGKPPGIGKPRVRGMRALASMVSGLAAASAGVSRAGLQRSPADRKLPDAGRAGHSARCCARLKYPAGR
jgi:putative Mn2+ efflux pump MntP